ncbi:pyridoxal phosphate-dependent decarboxylase family protein [Flavisolibacter tropicus]|uniref:Amino acid decarboxylase n=1 Tax=Flavisolibacter tropicus TaxID=1492898 RepID=A0A172TXX6_9BACT|nr:pyridoxal-dependent decarboxylase [Flavisolibacter tropicus]ANE51890.1 amino acid decarboxylase [Flavisolibacter tropicus]
MNTQLQQDLDNLSEILNAAKEQSLAYLGDIHKRPTTINQVPSLNNPTLPSQGQGALHTIQEFENRFQSLMVASSGPRYWGFVTGGSTPAAIMGDWLTSVYDQNTQSTKGQGDLSALIESETINLLLQLFQLPATYLGGFVTGATMSNFTCLAVARQWAGKQKGIDIAKEGVTSGIKILSATPHSSAIKSLAMLGLGSNHCLPVKVVNGNREAMDIQDLEEKLRAYNGEPCIVISSGGTVNTVDFDDMQAIAALKKKYNFWWHVDAAFGAFAACSPDYQHLLSGWDAADSITVDGHKWLNVPYDSAIFLIQEKHRHLQVETFQNSNAPYLGDPLENFTYLNFLPENSRRLRALPAWFTLMAYGKDGYQQIVENSINLSRQLGKRIESSELFELLAPVRLNTVCFTLGRSKDQPETVKAFLTELNSRGKVFMTPTVYKGVSGIRAALVNWRTTSEDINLVWAEMEAAYLSVKAN